MNEIKIPLCAFIEQNIHRIRFILFFNKNPNIKKEHLVLVGSVDRIFILLIPTTSQ